MKITREEKFRLTLTRNELETVLDGLFAYIKVLRPEDYEGSDPSDLPKEIIDAVTQLIGRFTPREPFALNAPDPWGPEFEARF